MAKYYNEADEKNQNNFTNLTNNDIINVEQFDKLNDTQKNNIRSAYNARKNGIISEEQYRKNVQKNINSIEIPKEAKEKERLSKLTGAYSLNNLNEAIRTCLKPFKTGFFFVVAFNIPRIIKSFRLEKSHFKRVIRFEEF